MLQRHSQDTSACAGEDVKPGGSSPPSLHHHLCWVAPSPGSLLQHVAALAVKALCLMSCPTLPQHNFMPFPCDRTGGNGQEVNQSLSGVSGWEPQGHGKFVTLGEQRGQNKKTEGMANDSRFCCVLIMYTFIILLGNLMGFC